MGKEQFRYALNDLWESEREYIRDMKYTIDNYYGAFDGDITATLKDKKDYIFANMPKLANFHESTFLKDLMQCQPKAASLGNTFLKYSKEFEEYITCYVDRDAVSYLLNQEESTQFLKSLPTNNQRGLNERLNRPLERIDQYIDILKDFMKYSSNAGEDLKPLQDAVQMLMDLKRKAEDLRLLRSIVGYPGDLSKLGSLLRHDDFIVWKGESDGKGKERHLFLFENTLLITKTKKGKTASGLPLYEFQNEINILDTQLNEH